MTDKDIVNHIQKLFDPSVSPGMAFDALFRMRQEHVTWDDVYRAVTTNGRARHVLQQQRQPQRLDENEDNPAKERECPGCGAARSTADYCINPACSEYKPNPETERIAKSAAGRFKNPKLAFGPYNGKHILDVVALNPGYVAELAQGTNPFWREQAVLAQFAAQTTAKPGHDTDATKFFD